jgi:solute carrier family 34 (sodium-dependent phosphate cotransporter)
VSSESAHQARFVIILKIVAVALCLYLFIVGVSGMGEAFKLFGRDFADRVLAATQNPFAALFMGILATSLVQSSSTSTSIIVGMVAGGALLPQAAIPMIMGANIGTTITAMLVSMGHITRPNEFERAFGAALLHLMFNLVAVAILFPLEITTGFLTHLATTGQDLFANVGGMRVSNPLKAATAPLIDLLKFLLFQNAVLLLIVTVALTYVMLIAIVKLLRSLVLTRIESFFDRFLFRNWRRAMVFGFLLTVAVQSSSIPTALAIPLAGAGILKLIQIYPFNLGANVGTTITALLAALATGEAAPVIVAFAHIIFNLLGIVFIWSIPPIRKLPLLAAEAIARRSTRGKLIPLAIFGGVYFVTPLILVLLIN